MKSISDQYGNHLYFEIYDSIYPYDQGRDVDFNASITITPKGTAKFMIDELNIFKIPHRKIYFSKNENYYTSVRNSLEFNGLLNVDSKKEYDFSISTFDSTRTLVRDFPFGSSTISYRNVTSVVFNIFKIK